MISAVTLFISDQLRSSSKSVEFAKGILSLVPSAALQSEGGQVTLQKATTFTGNVHLCYTITHLLYGVYIYILYRHLHKLYHTKILARCYICEHATDCLGSYVHSMSCFRFEWRCCCTKLRMLDSAQQQQQQQ